MLRRLIPALLLVGCGERIPDFTTAERDRIATLSPLGLPDPDPTNAVADDPDAARLGQRLFFDARLSRSGRFSCASCHDPDHGFADPDALSEAEGLTARHTPTVLNSAFGDWYFWDGRADSAWCQALKPLEAENEQGTTRVGIVHVLADDPTPRAEYEALFGPLPDPAALPDHARPVPDDPAHPDAIAWSTLTDAEQDAVDEVFASVGKAIAAYERLLVRGDAPFDRWVAGDEEALSASAQRGLALMLREGRCFDCHSGSALTNGSFHNLGLPARDGIDPADPGRYDGVTALLADPFNAAGAFSDDPEHGERLIGHLVHDANLEGQFETPSLRNVALTAPYMHGGHFDTLEEVVRFYVDLDGEVAVGHREELLLPLDWEEEDVADVVAFLESLTGAPLDEALTSAP